MKGLSHRIWYLLLALTLPLGLLARGVPAASKGPLAIRLMPADHVYALPCGYSNLLAERPSFSIVVHVVAILNQSPRPTLVESMSLEAIQGGKVIQRNVFDKTDLESLTAPVQKKLRVGLRGVLDLMIWTDQILAPEQEISPSADLKQGWALVIPNLYMACHRLPENLKITVAGKDGNKAVSAIGFLKVQTYTSATQYSLPVEGTWLMKGIPASGQMDHHRFGVSNEFGVDLLRVGPDGSFFKGDGRQASDHFSHGQNALAAADGTVVKVENRAIQDWTRFNPKDGETPEQFGLRQLNEVREALKGDLALWARGNYV